VLGIADCGLRICKAISSGFLKVRPGRNPKLENRRSHEWGLTCRRKEKPEPPLTNS
jgi:hypothetical protein